MFCQKCGTKKEDNAKFCSGCGVVTEISDAQKSDIATKDMAATNIFASQGIRLANYLIDAISMYVIVFVLAVIVVIVSGPVFTSELSDIESKGLGILSMILYYGFCETVWGRTIGKVLTKTKVVNKSGVKPSFSQIIKRTISRIVPFEPFSFLGSANPALGWHDKWSDTFVVKNNTTEKQMMDSISNPPSVAGGIKYGSSRKWWRLVIASGLVIFGSVMVWTIIGYVSSSKGANSEDAALVDGVSFALGLIMPLALIAFLVGIILVIVNHRK